MRIEGLVLLSILGVVMGGVLGLEGCSSGLRAYTGGADYEDAAKIEQLENRFSELDMQEMADTLARQIVACPSIAKSVQPVAVIVDEVANPTQDHLDRVSMEQKIRVALANSSRVRTGTDFILKSNLATRIQDSDGTKYVYYKWTANLANSKTSAIECSESQEVKKKVVTGNQRRSKTTL